ncbi:hypothetical protein CALVIDRAFT_532457 [Calocera viscosa TUFC12733]|uniref:Uncharacterized protein n=1 Tax=Calocera viscosa (strain TUFC12733) TaxID=1330018 RepID=A0A167S8Q1_CALVF|nr:hypothetical protein CALVIDRAFT_532457 [Calocera viscosa TUFC12733]
MAYESMAPSSLDMGDFSAYRPIRPLPKRKRPPLDFTDFPEELYEDLQHLPMDAAFMESLPSMFNSSSIDPATAEAYFPLFQGIQPDVVQPSVDAVLPAQVQSAAANGTEEDEDRGEGDYVDHLQNPANSKKRKVPGARRPDNLSPSASGATDPGGGGALDGAAPQDGLVQKEATVPRGRVSRAGLARERIQEKLRARRRQLENVIPQASDEPTNRIAQKLAVDIALAQLNVPSAPASASDGTTTKWRSLKRKAGMAASTRKPLADKYLPKADHGTFAYQDFTFERRGPTSDLYVTVCNDMHKLQATFEDELTRQAAKAAEEASKLAAIVASHQAAAEKGAKGDAKARKRPSSNQASLSSASPEVTGMAKNKGSKKKKRSAIANASNPHHFRNYVPSRLPYTSHPSGAAANAASLNLAFGPLPVEFLTAPLPPRRGKPADLSHDVAAAVPPADEWICPFCDYDLFYGDEAKFRKAIRKRKRILRRRRRARERAAAAAGTTAVAPPAESQSGGYVEDDEVISNAAERPDAGYPSTGAPRGKREGAG